MQLTVNGERVTVDERPGESLLQLLREQVGLRSMKDGCAPEGSCGACTVIVDGRAVVSCAQPASRFADREVRTLEGLSAEGRADWADALVHGGASQCGFCSPGIVMKAEALLARAPDPSRDEIARALAGNLCRCTGYVKVIDAIADVAARRRGVYPADTATGPGAVGGRVPKYAGREQVLGEHAFVADMRVPDMLHGALRFSDHPRAAVLRIDTAPAQAYPGVVRVVTWRDVPGERFCGLIERDWPPFVAEGEEARYVGDVLAAVAAETRAAAREAAELIRVEYEVLAPVVDPEEALGPDAPPIHPGGNLLSTSVVRRGDVEAALATAAHVASNTFTTQRIEHAFLEPEAVLAVPRAASGDGDAPRLRIFSQGQGAWEDRRQLATFLALPETSIRVTQVATGGAFGGKEDLSVQAQTSLLALVAERPVLLVLSRRESLRIHPKRHPMSLSYTVGCDAEGHLLAVRARIVGDTGAYASVGAKVLERAAGHACGAYRVANVDVEARAVCTNNAPAGAMRGFGVPQVTFALEGLLDVLAERVGIDGWEIRWRNAMTTGDRFGSGQRLTSGVGLQQTLLAVRDAYRSARYAGIACGAKNTGIGNGMTERGRAILRPEADGTLTLFHSWTEMGQGIHTAMAQIAAEELRIPVDRIRVVVDTEHELDTGETTASRATVLGGQAVLDAARRLNRARDGKSLEQLAGHEFPGEFVVDWTTELREDDPEPMTHLAYGWATQVVILDDEGRLARVVAAHDVGRAINPLALEGQVEGGVHMGLGYALSEEYVVDGGVPVTDTLKSLNIIPAAGMPPVEVILVEEPQAEGPYGAKGAGEAVLVPTAAAVAGALHAFDGIRRTSLPMTDSAAARAAVPRLVRHGRGEPRPAEVPR
ncbi:MAG: selenium-dependent xanthine dehydrogenase [Chloroflexota bacterium]|nr:selenium-dependent xanthine dehydrogenase [Chloroflexota bacterium]